MCLSTPPVAKRVPSGESARHSTWKRNQEVNWKLMHEIHYT